MIAPGLDFFVPLLGICCYWDASTMAKRPGLPVPTKATVGLVLSLLFGGGQCLAVAGHLMK
jgi:hypothetical protein